MGSWILNFACIIAIFFNFGIYPAAYDSPTLATRATITFWLLIVTHLVQGVSKVHALYFSDFFWDKQPALMLLTVGMQIGICSWWRYDEERPKIAGLNED